MSVLDFQGAGGLLSVSLTTPNASPIAMLFDYRDKASPCELHAQRFKKSLRSFDHVSPGTQSCSREVKGPQTGAQ